MSRQGVPPGVAGPQGDVLYFYLSYARLGPLPDEGRDLLEDDSPGLSPPGFDEDLDPAVDKFFKDLTDTIGMRPGDLRPRNFYDRNSPSAADPVQAAAEALGQTQVFVPLYSPHYLETTWTRREQEAFRARMEGLGRTPMDRTLPVLWTPVPHWIGGPHDREALQRARGLADDVSAYAQDGLRVICLQDRFRAAYEVLLHRIAAEILALAEGAPVAPSTVDLAGMSPQPNEDPSFIVTVFRGSPTHPASHVVGQTPAWHPYRGKQVLPVADLVARTAERLGLAPRPVDFDSLQDFVHQNPVLILVDPRVLERGGGETELHRAFEALPVWARPMVIGDSPRGESHALAVRTQDVLSAAVPASAEAGHRPVDRVDGPGDLEAQLPLALARARQSYLKYGMYTSSAPDGPGATQPPADGAPSERGPR
jgi:hypothetical protein